MPETILGISAYYHDSAAALLRDGLIVAAAQEERFSRIKHDASFPTRAVEYVLKEGGITIGDLSAIAFYDKPYLKFERLLETYHCFAPKGLRSFLSAMPVWIKEKLFMRTMLKEQLAGIDDSRVKKLLFPEHHLSHAASAFFPSPFKQAAILTIDGVGEWATTTIGYGNENDIKILRQLNFPHSVGLLYSAFTYYCGFKVNSGEYKLMGLAPYGHPNVNRIGEWKNLILEEMADVRPDGSILLNMDFFDFATGLTMCNKKRWERLFQVEKRRPESDLTQPYMDMALAIQQITEEIIFRLAQTAQTLTGSENLVMAGGVALNCVANGKLLKNHTFKNIWIQPASGDAGGALGAALSAWHIWMKRPRDSVETPDGMQGTYLGPEFFPQDIQRVANRYGAVFEKIEDIDTLCDKASQFLAQGHVVGWFQGRMEYGPRALGNRSILGDPRNPETQKKLNLKIKYREGFRPFAPSVIEEDISEYFQLAVPSPFMLLVAPVEEKRRNPLPENYDVMPLYPRLYQIRSDIPAVTHVDFSARIQSVHRRTNQRYWTLINAFKKRTGIGLVVNTSFNVRGEPIVCTPDDAYRCFMRTEMDYLVMGNFIFDKKEQPLWQDKENWSEAYKLD